MQAYVHLGNAATYLLSHATGKVSGHDHSLLHFFEDSEYSLIGSDSGTYTTADALFETWLANLLEIYDACATYPFFSKYTQVQPFFIYAFILILHYWITPTSL